MNKDEIKHVVTSELDKLFVKLHKRFNTSSGDITPEQELKLQVLQEELCELISTQVHQNLDS